MSQKPVGEMYQLWQQVAAEFNAAVSMRRKPSPEVNKNVFVATLAVLRAYCRPGNFSEDGASLETFPPAVAKAIADQIGYLLAGRLPEPIQDVTRRGAPAVGPHEGRDIGLAVAYMKLAKAGIIVDPAHNRTVQEWYGVEASAVRKWARRHPAVEPSDFFPDLDDRERPAEIARAARAAGLRYRQAGRGAAGRYAFPRPGKQGGGPSR